MLPRGMSKSTELTATRPPNRFVTLRARTRIWSSGTCPVSGVDALRVGDAGRHRGVSSSRAVAGDLAAALRDGLAGGLLAGHLREPRDPPRRRARSDRARARAPSSSSRPIEPIAWPGGAVCISAARWRLGRKPSGRNRIITTSAMPSSRKLKDEGLMSLSCSSPVAPPTSDRRLPTQASRVLSTYWTTTAPTQHAPDVPDAAEDDHDHDQDRGREHEEVGRRGALVGRLQGSRDARERRAQGEREELGADRVDAHHLGRDLVLADGHPGAAHARPFQVSRDDDGDDDERDAEIDRREAADHAELEPEEAGRIDGVDPERVHR